MIAARNADALAAAAEELASESGRRVIGVPTDTGDEDSLQALVARTVEELGGIDILVNSAATPWSSGKPRDFASTRTISCARRWRSRCSDTCVPQER